MLKWNSNTLSTSCEELTHWKRPWCWEKLGAEGEWDDRRWDGWMASLTQWTWVWVNSGSWWWTGRPGVLGFMGSQRVGRDWAIELNWYVNNKEYYSKNLVNLFNEYLYEFRTLFNPWVLPIIHRHTHTEVTQLCPTLCDPINCSPTGSSVPGIFQAWILECFAISFSMCPS